MPELPVPSNSRYLGPMVPVNNVGTTAVPATYGPAASRQSGEFLEYWHVLRDNLLWISLLATFGAGLGWIIALVQPSMYQAKIVLDIRSLNENFLNPHEGTPIGTSGTVLPESYIQTEIKILSSDSLRKRALEHLPGLEHPLPAPIAEPGSFWHSLTGPLNPAPGIYKTLAADAARRVKVRAVGNTRIVEVWCDARDGQLAADMCNSLARSYIEYNLESRYKSTKETGDWLQSQLDDVRKRLTKAENDLKDSSKETAFLFDAETSASPDEDRLRQLQNELSRSQADRITKESDYMIANSRSTDSLPAALDSGAIREYRMRLMDLKRQAAELSTTMTPEHYKVRELNSQMAEVERSLQKEREDVLSRLRADYDVARRRESVFGKMYQQQAAQVSQHADKAVRYNMLKQEVDSERKLYQTLLQKVDEVGLSAALRTSTISVVDAAAAPVQPYAPRRVANVGVGFLGGSLLGLSMSLIRLRYDRTLHGPGEASSHLQLRELGVIPSVRNGRVKALLRRMRSSRFHVGPISALKLDKALVPSMPLGKGARNSTALATWLRVPEMREAVFGTMSSLRFATERGERANVIVLTSPESGEGKTTVATNLAIALAQIGRRVLLVDCDLRRPSLDSIFETACQGGLASILESQEPIETLQLDRFLFYTPIVNLKVLPTIPDCEGICTKIHSTRMRLLLDRLRKEFDNVIIDSPPMLHISDARVLGWLADGVLLVLRARKTTKDSALAAYQCLTQDGVHVFGTVLNDWRAGRNDQYGAAKSYAASA